MNNSAPFQPRWHLSGLLLCNVAALLLLLSWLWGPTRELWDLFDDELFRTLNTPLANAPWWALAWAIGSLRPTDIAVGLIMLAVMLRGNWAFPVAQVRRGLLTFVALLVMLLAIRFLFTSFADHVGWQHASPSEVLTGAVRLTELYPDWERTLDLKDASGASFPGDHASVLLIWAMFLSLFARGWKLLLIWALDILFILPRLVAGAHWGSDDFVGGLFVALMALGWGCCTPLASWGGQLLMALTQPLFNAAARLPLVRRLSLVRSGK